MKLSSLGSRGTPHFAKLSVYSQENNFYLWKILLFSHFAFYDKNETIIPLHKRNIYEQDTLGLRSLDEKGRLHIFSVSGVHHHFWHRNETVLQNYILPWLDWKLTRSNGSRMRFYKTRLYCTFMVYAADDWSKGSSCKSILCIWICLFYNLY